MGVSSRSHPRSAVSWNRQSKAFQLKNVKLRGIIPHLTKRFYPSYSYAKAIKNCPPQSNDKRIKADKSTNVGRPGCSLGIKMDKEIARTVKLANKHKLPAEFFFDKKHASRSKVSVSVRKGLAKLMPFVPRFWRVCSKLKLTPIDTQVFVGCEKARVGSACDVVVKDSRNRYCILEIKTGFGYYESHTTVPMKKPFHAKTDSPHNQHQLQLAGTRLLYRHTFPDHKMGDCFVLRFDSEGVDIYPLESWVLGSAGDTLL